MIWLCNSLDWLKMDRTKRKEIIYIEVIELLLVIFNIQDEEPLALIFWC